MKKFVAAKKIILASILFYSLFLSNTLMSEETALYSPAFFTPKLFHSSINYADSNAVFSYSYYKAFDPSNFNYHFIENELYSYYKEIDLKNNIAVIKVKFDGAEIIPTFALPLEKLWEIQMKMLFYTQFYEELAKTTTDSDYAGDTQGLIRDIEFPDIKMPRAMRRFFGDKLGRLKVTGSQKITIEGSRTVTEGEAVVESTKRNILPELKMEQKLNLGINGTIGDKITVDVDQTSEESIFKENKINIKYVGDEDDPIKLIEGGDTRLSLSGSQFISYSASSENLFGLKGEFEFGKLELTTIISQQEGQHASARATGTAKVEVKDIIDMRFERNKYFYIGNPNFEDGNSIFTIDSTGIATKKDSMPKDGTVRVFLHDGGTPDLVNERIGYAIDDILYQDDYYFQELDPMSDFFINYVNSPHIITFNKYISNSDVIGIVYEKESGEAIGNADTDTITVKLIKKSYDGVLSDEVLWNYQLKNRYSLGARNIEKEDFEVKIYHEDPGGGKIEGITIDSVYHTYVNLFGLTNRKDDEQVTGDDDELGGKIDLTAGIISFPIYEIDEGRNTIFVFEPFSDLVVSSITSDSISGNDEIYTNLYPDPTDYDPFYISVKMKKTGGYIELGQMNIIKNSEKVYVDDELKQKGVDYDIDYLGGTVTLKGGAAIDPNADVKVDFEYEPLFALNKKSMFGVRADYEFNRNAKLGATLMYESEAVKDQHAKLGSEPKKILVGNIDGELAFDDLPFVTKLVNKIPLVKTDAKSSLSLSGEVAMNIPTPNATKKKEAYLEDMESVVEKFSLGINRMDWTFASFPDISTLDTSAVSRGKMNWYNPYHEFQAGDIYEELSTNEKNEYVTVLECSLQVSDTTDTPHVWGGIMKALGSSSIDFSEKKYLEIMLKSDANASEEGDSLFIDLGYISEDFYPLLAPNGHLDKEDGSGGEYADGSLDIGEDVGLDGIANGTEGDDEDDNYSYSAGSQNYGGINGTEGNGRLDSEDLDGNNNLDIKNRYFQYAINLNAINLENVDNDILISDYNGWKFIRIPLQDSLYYQRISDSEDPDFSYIKYARIWAKTDSSSSLKIDIASCEVVGNKWKTSAIRDTSLDIVDPTSLGANEEFDIATDNNKENPNYTPPPGSLDENKEKDETQIEQSIFLDCKNIQPDRYIFARQNFAEALNLLTYDKIKLWVYGRTEDSTATETIIFRLGADTANYYEYRKEISVYDDIGSKMQEGRWQPISVYFTEFTDLKKADVSDTLPQLGIVGNPSLRNVKQIAVGLIRPADLTADFSGKIYFNDMRLANPYDEIGVASRITLTADLADLADITINFSNETPNFYSLGETSGRGSNRISYSISNDISLNKFLPSVWGFNIPLNLDYSFSETKPRFQPTSDVKITSKAEKDSLKTLDYNRSAYISFTKSKESSNPIVKYLVDNTTITGRISKNEYLSPTLRDTTVSYDGTFNYDLSLSRDNSVELFKNFKLFYLPQEIHFDLDYSYSHSRKWKKQTLTEMEFINETRNPTETAETTLRIDNDIFTDFDNRYTLTTTRNLQKRLLLKNINIGVETERTQTISIGYDPSFLEIFDFSSSYHTTYHQTRNEISKDNSISIQYEVRNDRTITGGLSLKFDKWGNDLMNAVTLPAIVEDEPTEADTTGTEIFDDTEEGISSETDTTGTEILDDTEEGVSSETEDDSTEVGKKELKKGHSPFLTIASTAGKAVGFGVKNLGNVNVNYTNNFNTQYNTKGDSIPGFGYQTGIYDLESGESFSSFAEINNISVSTSNRFDIFTTLSANMQANYDWNKSEASGNKTETINYTLPNIELTYSGLSEIITWDFISNPSISSRVTRIISEEISISPSNSENITLASSITLPLDLMKNTNINISASHTLGSIKGVNSIGNETGTKNQGITISNNMSYSFQSAKGINIPLLGRINMKNDLDIYLDISYSSNAKDNYIHSIRKWQPETNTNTLTIEPRVSYSFSTNINGGLTAKYESTNDKKLGKSTRATSLNFWVEFKF